MVNWKVTATTIYCDAVDDEVTIIVNKDGSASCVSFARYGNPDKDIAGLMKKKSQSLNRELRCEGPECSRVTGYRDKLFAEEKEVRQD